MNGNELINTNITGYTPLVSPRGFEGIASRADKRISSTQKRVQDLVKLDPTNPLASLITFLGANQERGIRDELNTLRGQTIEQDRKTKKIKADDAWRKKALGDLKTKGLDKAFERFVNEDHGGDIDAALKDNNMQGKLNAYKNEYKPLEDKEVLQLFAELAKEQTELNNLKISTGGKIDPEDENFHKMAVRGIRETLRKHFEHKYGKKFSDSKIDSMVGSPTGTGTPGSGTPPPPVVGKVPLDNTGQPRVKVPNKVKSAKAVLKGKPTKPVAKRGTELWREDFNDGIREIVKSSDEGTLKKDLMGFIKSYFKGDKKGKSAPKPRAVPTAPNDPEKVGAPISPMDVTGSDSANSYDYIVDKLNEAHSQSNIPPDVLAAANERAYAKALGVDSAMGESTLPPELTTQDLIGLPDLSRQATQPHDSGAVPMPEVTPMTPYAGLAEEIARKSEDGGENQTVDTPFSGIVDGWNALRDSLSGESDETADPRDSIRKSKQEADRLQAILRGEINEQGYTPEEQANIDRTRKQAGVASGDIPVVNDLPRPQSPKALDPVPQVDPSMIPKAGRDLGEERSKAEAMQKKAAMKRLRSDPFVNKLIQIESSGREDAIGYKMHKDPRTGKFVHDTVKVKDKWGRTVNRKIPVSYGLMQITVPTAKASKLPAAEKAFKGKSDKVIARILLENPELNVRIGKEFAGNLRKQLKQNAYAKKFTKQEIDVLVGAAYNWKGEGLDKLITKAKPENFAQVLARIKFPAETRRQIKELRKALK
jgi:hypothetical protein